jgi:hypothetical protein
MVAALLFAGAWLRSPVSLSGLEALFRIFIGYGIILALLSLIVGLPLVNLFERYKLGHCWTYIAVATATGALVAAAVTSHPTGGIDNPFGLVFSPWTRDSPGFISRIPIRTVDYVGSIIFCAIVGGALGASFWRFYSRGARP